jgi:CopG antitoxin of type II toxin-antitoxin system
VPYLRNWLIAVREVFGRTMLRKQCETLRRMSGIASKRAGSTSWAKQTAKAKKVALPNLKHTSKTISLRLPQQLLDSLKVAVNARDVRYQSPIKVWLKEKLQGH